MSSRAEAFGAFNGRERRRGCSIVGHSAAGWISRIYLSEERYGGHSHRGLARGVGRLVTLGSPHAASDGVAFANVAWARREPAPVELSRSRARAFAATRRDRSRGTRTSECGLSRACLLETINAAPSTSRRSTRPWIDVTPPQVLRPFQGRSWRRSDGDGVAESDAPGLRGRGNEVSLLAGTTIHAAKLPSFLSPGWPQ